MILTHRGLAPTDTHWGLWAGRKGLKRGPLSPRGSEEGLPGPWREQALRGGVPRGKS